MYPTIFSPLVNSALFFWSMLSNIVSLISVSRKISHNKMIFQTHDLLLCWHSIQSSSFGHRSFFWTSFQLLFAFLKSRMRNFNPNCCPIILLPDCKRMRNKPASSKIRTQYLRNRSPMLFHLSQLPLQTTRMGRNVMVVRAHIGKVKLVLMNSHLESTAVSIKILL